MPLYMLDTDTVSCLLGGKTPALDVRLAAASAKHLCISAVTRGELLYGLKLKDGAHRLAQLLDQLLLRCSACLGTRLLPRTSRRSQAICTRREHRSAAWTR